jgi:hypothetical protein
MKLFEIAAYRHALRDIGAVTKFQDRDRRKRVFSPEFGTAIDRLHEVDFLVRYLDTLLGEKDANAARIWAVELL